MNKKNETYLKDHIWDLVVNMLPCEMKEQAKRFYNEGFCKKTFNTIEDEMFFLVFKLREEIIDYDNYVNSGDAKEDELCGEM